MPWTIVQATQFHHYAGMVSSWTEKDGARIAPTTFEQWLILPRIQAVRRIPRLSNNSRSASLNPPQIP